MSDSRAGGYVDVEMLVATWLTAQVPGVRAVTVVPETIPAGGVFWIAPVGGSSDWDEAIYRVDVQTLKPGSYGAANSAAAAAHAAMGDLGGSTVGTQAVHRVHTLGVPSHQYWSPDVDRLVATYELRLPVYR